MPTTICFTNAHGIIYATCDDDHVTITFTADGTDEPVEIYMPRFKFEWIIESFNETEPSAIRRWSKPAA